jgi:hypothetical protein
MQISVSNPAATHQGIKIALTTISNLQNDLRFVLHLHREGQRSFAKKAESMKKHTKQLSQRNRKSFSSGHSSPEGTRLASLGGNPSR